MLICVPHSPLDRIISKLYWSIWITFISASFASSLCFKLLVSSNSFFTVRARRTTGGTTWKHYEIQRTFEIIKLSVFTVKHTHARTHTHTHTYAHTNTHIRTHTHTEPNEQRHSTAICSRMFDKLSFVTQSPTHTKGITLMMCQGNWLLPIHQDFKTIRPGMQASILKRRQ